MPSRFSPLIADRALQRLRSAISPDAPAAPRALTEASRRNWTGKSSLAAALKESRAARGRSQTHAVLYNSAHGSSNEEIFPDSPWLRRRYRQSAPGFTPPASSRRAVTAAASLATIPAPIPPAQLRSRPGTAHATFSQESELWQPVSQALRAIPLSRAVRPRARQGPRLCRGPLPGL